MVRFNCSAGPRRLFGSNATSIGNGDPDGVMTPLVVMMRRVFVDEMIKLLLFCSAGSVLIMTMLAVLLMLSSACGLTAAVRSLGGIIKLKDRGCRLEMVGTEMKLTVNVSSRA